MATTYLSLNVHIVFATKGRVSTIDDSWRPDLHGYIGGVVRGLNGTPLAVGGVSDHVHLLAGIRGTHCVSDFVREIKKASSVWAAEHNSRFSWQTGYGAFSVGVHELPVLKTYIARQEDHHRQVSSADELRALLAEHGVAYDEQYFE